jgi:hypothetical protein
MKSAPVKAADPAVKEWLRNLLYHADHAVEPVTTRTKPRRQARAKGAKA